MYFSQYKSGCLFLLISVGIFSVNFSKKIGQNFDPPLGQIPNFYQKFVSGAPLKINRQQDQMTNNHNLLFSNKLRERTNCHLWAIYKLNCNDRCDSFGKWIMFVRNRASESDDEIRWDIKYLFRQINWNSF